MKFHQPKAEVFVPDQQPIEVALSRVTHLGVGAHQDDLEFMAYHGILECFQRTDRWFGGVTCTNGAGSSRTGAYANYSDEQMQEVRREEQCKAASVGDFAFVAQLDYSSGAVKNPGERNLEDDLERIVAASSPEVIYTHNPADKHDTHIGVLVALLGAVRRRPMGSRPKKIYGCEVWRDLDWLADSEKAVLDVSGRPNLAGALNGIFDSQIAGGKRYDLAIMGRRCANATFFDSHATDAATHLSFAMDLTALIEDDTRDLVDFTCSAIARFHADVENKLKRQLGRL